MSILRNGKSEQTAHLCASLCLILAAQWVAGREGPQPSVAKAVAPRTYCALEAFGLLARYGGPPVIPLNIEEKLLVPEALRFVPVKTKPLADAVCAAHKLKVHWTRNGSFGILYKGMADDALARVQADLASADADRRRQAAWRAGRSSDIRVIPLLVRAARDANHEVKERALADLRHAGWDVVLALDPSALDLVAAELNPDGAGVFFNPQHRALQALGDMGGEQARDLLVSLFPDTRASIRIGVLRALGRLTDKKNVPLFESAFEDPRLHVRVAAVHALGLGDERAWTTLERALEHGETTVKLSALVAAESLGGDRATAFLRAGLLGSERAVVHGAALGLVRMLAADAYPMIEEVCKKGEVLSVSFPYEGLIRADAEKARRLLDSLWGSDPFGRPRILMALGLLGGTEALDRLERESTNESNHIRRSVATALGRIGGDRAVQALASLSRDYDPNVRRVALAALGRLGDRRVVPLVDAAMNDAYEQVRFEAYATALGLPHALDADMPTALARAFGLKTSRRNELLAQARRDVDAKVRTLGVALSAEIDEADAWAQLEKDLQDEDLTAAAMRAIMHIGGVKAFPMMEVALAANKKADAALRDKKTAPQEQLTREQHIAKSAKQQRFRRLCTDIGNLAGGPCSLNGQQTLKLLEAVLQADPLNHSSAGIAVLANMHSAKAVPWLKNKLLPPEARHVFGGRPRKPEALEQWEKSRTRTPDFPALTGVVLDAAYWTGGPDAFAMIETALSHPTYRSRFEAVRVLKNYHSEASTALLVKAAEDKDPTVSDQALSALGGEHKTRALEQSLKAMANRNQKPAQRRDTLSAALQLGGNKAVEAIEAMLSDPRRKVEERLEILNALSVADNQSLFDLLERVLQDDDPRLRRGAVDALKRAGGERAVNALVPALGDADPQVRRAASLAIREIETKSDPL